MSKIASPCQKICVVHPGAGICVGCYRTAEEIAGWIAMDDATRRALIAELPDRAGRLTAREARPSRVRAARRRAREG